ncbi:hypothetical protein V6Z11_A08G202600 [Gossypium hirsutum]|uniref:ATP-dependent Clp protease proteolytic subunit-related protein 2, chloroplastic isoform X1 n=1 Tax=Gossypium hirsutum TaxID=3635 RepID=A0A1U8LFT0_GOSHI|nr:ATP-dependent Clp protease proteolytic subunit-related protein 2, chloroplastic-like isoform X1 [Gossypium hirsutum]
MECTVPRAIYIIRQHIDEEFSNQILATMLYLDSIDDNKRLYFYINGPGDLTPSLAIYDTMESLKSPVGTHCVGYAYNLAGFLLAAGEKINKDLSRMKRFNAQQALEYGLIDRIVRPPRIKADAPRKDVGAGLAESLEWVRNRTELKLHKQAINKSIITSRKVPLSQ